MGEFWDESWRTAPVLIPAAASAVLVGYICYRRVRDGVSPIELPMDRKFLLGTLYTGALLTIYLSCYFFFLRLGISATGP